MQSMINRFNWKNIWKSYRMRIAFCILMIILFIGTAFCVGWTFTRPQTSGDIITRVRYSHAGLFDYDVYVNGSTLHGTPSQTEEQNSIYFTNIIDTIDVSFDYELLTEATMAEFTGNVEVKALLERTGEWQKEIVIVPRTEATDNVTVSFPLDIHQLIDLVIDIGEEIQRDIPSFTVTLTAAVSITAETDQGVFKDDFVQTTMMGVGGTILEWEGGLILVEKDTYEDINYLHYGRFDYAINLKENQLYGQVTLGPPLSQETPQIVLIPKSSLYFPRIIDSIDASYSYTFSSQQLVNGAQSTADITATLEHEGFWSKDFFLATSTSDGREIAIDFPIDIQQFLEYGETVKNEIGIGAEKYNLIIRANVQTTAQTDYGSINETFIQNISGTLSSSTLKLDQNLTRVQSGSITENLSTTNNVWPARIASLCGILLVVLIGYYVISESIKVAPAPLSVLEKEAIQVKKKHKDIIIDVSELPELKDQDRVIILNSLEELVKAADGLLKPVLHKAETDKHTYCVIDADFRYEYVGKIEEEPLENNG
jgi:Tfp pilus assembly protein PilO